MGNETWKVIGHDDSENPQLRSSNTRYSSRNSNPDYKCDKEKSIEMELHYLQQQQAKSYFFFLFLGIF